MSEIRRFLSAYEFQLDALANDIQSVVDTFESSKAEADRLQQQALTDARALRAGLLREFGERAETVEVEIVNVIQRWKLDIENSKAILQREAAGGSQPLRQLLCTQIRSEL